MDNTILKDEITNKYVSVRQKVLVNEALISGLVLAIAFAGGIFLRVWQINAMGFNTDEAVYSGQAAALAGIPVLKDIFPIFRAHPLLFQVLLSLVYKIQFSDLAARLLAAGIGIGTIFLTYQIGKTLYGRLAGAMAALFIAIMPYHVIVSRQVLLDGPMVFFTTLTLYFLVRFGTSQKAYWLYFSGAAMGLAVLSKETSIILLGAIYAFLALASDLRVRIKDVVISLFVWLLVVSPFPISLIFSGVSTTGKNYLAWQLFRRPNHEWSFYLTNVPLMLGGLLIVAAVVGIALLWRERSWKEKLLYVWIVVTFAFFQLWPVKGFQYLLPLAPAVAVLAARLIGKILSSGFLESLPKKIAAFPYLRLFTWLFTLVMVFSMALFSWQRIQPNISSRFLAGTGGVPGGREAGAWIKENVPLNATFLTIGPSMANIIQFYGERKAYGLSVSPNPLHRNPSYTPINNPDAQIRSSDLQYLVWDSFSASRSSFFSDKVMGYVSKYNGRIIHEETIVVNDAAGKPIVQPIIIIYEVHP